MAYKISKYALGRKPAKEYLKKHGHVTISAFKYRGEMRYTGPVTQAAHRSKPSILYRIKIKWKKP